MTGTMVSSASALPAPNPSTSNKIIDAATTTTTTSNHTNIHSKELVVLEECSSKDSSNLKSSSKSSFFLQRLALLKCLTTTTTNNNNNDNHNNHNSTSCTSSHSTQHSLAENNSNNKTTATTAASSSTENSSTTTAKTITMGINKLADSKHVRKAISALSFESVFHLNRQRSGSSSNSGKSSGGHRGAAGGGSGNGAVMTDNKKGGDMVESSPTPTPRSSNRNKSKYNNNKQCWSRGSLHVQAQNMLHGTLDPEGGVEVVFYDCHEYGDAGPNSPNEFLKVDFRRDSVVMESISVKESSLAFFASSSDFSENDNCSSSYFSADYADRTSHDGMVLQETIEVSTSSPSHASSSSPASASALRSSSRLLWNSMADASSSIVGGVRGGGSPRNSSMGGTGTSGGIGSGSAALAGGSSPGFGGGAAGASDSQPSYYYPPHPPPPPKELPLRFLRAGKGDPVEGLRRYEATLQWRKQEKIDTILREPSLHFDLIKANYPHFFAGKGRLGEPVFYERPPKTDLKALQDGGVTLDLLLRHYAMVSEFQWQYLERDDLQRSVYIIDLEGIRFGDFVGEVVDFVKKASALSAQHYPERAGYVFVINVPVWFKMIWAVVKPLVDESTLDKIYILRGAEEIRQNMLERIPLEYIPADYGGEGPPLGESDEEKEFRALIEHNNALVQQGVTNCGPHGCPSCRFCTWQQPRSY